MDMKKIGLFAAGVLFGTAGLKVLTSKDAKKAYAQTTAAALRAKESVMTTVTAVREGADDIYAEAQARTAETAKGGAGAWHDPRELEEGGDFEYMDQGRQAFLVGLLLVIADAITADETLSLLMGGDVEPRREFITENSSGNIFSEKSR